MMKTAHLGEAGPHPVIASAARNLGLGDQIAHDDRYGIADEFLDVVYKLWEGSWEDGAVLRDRDTGVFTDPEKVHPIDHRGEHFDVPGIHLGEPSPQRTPVIFQAGASPRGQEFAARHGEAIFINGLAPELTRRTTDGIRDKARAAGRDGLHAWIGDQISMGLIVSGGI